MLTNVPVLFGPVGARRPTGGGSGRHGQVQLGPGPRHRAALPLPVRAYCRRGEKGPRLGNFWAPVASKQWVLSASGFAKVLKIYPGTFP